MLQDQQTELSKYKQDNIGVGQGQGDRYNKDYSRDYSKDLKEVV